MCIFVLLNQKKGIDMKKNIIFTTSGHRADVGEMEVYRMLPNYQLESVGPFVFLDHVPLSKHDPDEPLKAVNGSGAHPHRGIATLTYILNGEADHHDSKGHQAIVNSGGAQWMKAGNGIIHDEVLNVDSKTDDLVSHGFQFWINLPSKQKAEPAEYLPIQANEIPKKLLDDNAGWIKVIAGNYEGLVSKIPSYSKQFLYHIHVEAGKQFVLLTEGDMEYAAFLPLQDVMINDVSLGKGEFIAFDSSDGNIEIKGNLGSAVDVLLFGGEKYNEPIVFGGPFVMNSQAEIAQAYRDFHLGKYGNIKYN
jgi:redox-sensitive bicupin YhaK (pirin superfamily)